MEITVSGDSDDINPKQYSIYEDQQIEEEKVDLVNTEDEHGTTDTVLEQIHTKNEEKRMYIVHV